MGPRDGRGEVAWTAGESDVWGQSIGIDGRNIALDDVCARCAPGKRTLLEVTVERAPTSVVSARAAYEDVTEERFVLTFVASLPCTTCAGWYSGCTPWFECRTPGP